MTIAEANFSLSEAEMDAFRKDGYLGPFDLCSEAEMADLRPGLEQVLERDAPDHGTRVHNRHFDSPWVDELSTRRPIVERMQSLYGPDLLLWRTNFFVKEPGAKEIPWHQDHNYWPLEPPIISSAWIAIDEATVENSCVQIIPGSHRKTLPHIKATDDMVFAEMGDPDYIDTSQLVNLEMKAGQFVLFNERTVHHSEPNRSQKRRIGLAVRVIMPIVKVLQWDAPEHALVQIAGEDCLQFNRTTQPPV